MAMINHADGYQTVDLSGTCKDCGWPVVFSCSNGPMQELHPMTDYWCYCSNQACKNHSGGESGCGDYPDFFEY